MSFDANLNLATLLLAGAMSAMLAGVLRWYATPHQQTHYRHWTSAWIAQAAYYLIGALAFTLAILGIGGNGTRLALSVATQVANTFASALLLIGAVGFVRRQPVDTRALHLALLISIVLGALIAVSGMWTGGSSLVRTTYRSLITSASFIGSGLIIWRSRPASDRPARLLALALFVFGAAHVHYLGYALLSIAGRRPAYPLAWFTLLDLLWLAAIAIAMAAMAFADQREAAATALRRQENAFRQMIEHSNDITAVLDAQQTVQYLSPSAHRVLGWGEEAVGRGLLEFVHPDDQPGIIERIQAEDPGAVPYTLRVRTKGGNWLRIEAVSRRSLDEHGAAIAIVNGRDVSERERLEASLREAQKLESVGRLAGGVAHDLNNVLMIIGSEAQLLSNGASAEVSEGLREISAATDRATELTRQLLTFARRQVVQPRVMNVSDAISNTARMAARLVRESIEFRLVPPAADHFALIDPTQLGQVVINLLVNARDAIPDQGTIELSVRERSLVPLEAPGMPPGQYVAITVRDTGVGIRDADRALLFEPFFTTKSQGEGTGLGLATSYGIVRQAGGCILVESTVGRGSTFEVLLPSAERVDISTETASPAAPRAQGEWVLVVEDEPTLRALQVRALTSAGFRVAQAADGIAALDRHAENHGIRVVVTDVIMPRMGGVEAARRLREQDASLGILFLSGYPGELDFLETLPAGCRFLQKPVAMHELVKAVHALLEANADPQVSSSPAA